MAHIRVRKTRQPEIRDLSVQLLVQQDIARLHVPMVDRRHCREMQVGQSLSSRVRDAEAALPGQHIRLGTLQVIQQGPIGDVFVDQQRLLQLDAAAEQAYEALVVDLAEDPDLVEDLVGALGVSELGALDGNQGAVVEDSLVDLAIAAGAEEAVLGEVVGSFLQLFAGEDLCGLAAAGVEDLLALAGEALLLAFDELVAPVDEESD